MQIKRSDRFLIHVLFTITQSIQMNRWFQIYFNLMNEISNLNCAIQAGTECRPKEYGRMEILRSTAIKLEYQ